MKLKIAKTENNLKLVDKLVVAISALDSTNSMLENVGRKREYLKNEMMDLNEEKGRLAFQIQGLEKSIEKMNQDLERLKEKQNSEVANEAIKFFNVELSRLRELVLVKTRSMLATDGMLLEKTQRDQALMQVQANTEARKRVYINRLKEASKNLQKETGVDLFAEIVLSNKEFCTSNFASTIEIEEENCEENQ